MNVQRETIAVPAADSPAGKRVLSIFQLLEAASPTAIALMAPDRRPLTYRALLDHVAATVRSLRQLGIGRQDRVALVLPNGPEMAAAFLATASAATCAPLNPAYQAQEFEFYLSDLQVKALIILSGDDSSARAVAQKLKIPVIELARDAGAEAGLFDLSGEAVASASSDEVAVPEDIALILHTSGTTSKPKMVPLSHANLCSSASHIRRTLNLSEKDRCLNVMPLFHIHGLIGALLSSLSAGASVICSPGFLAPHFLEWLREFHPSWYTAVPTMHQAILSRVPQTGLNHTLRLIRSSSAALAPSVMAELEKAFGVPVIESYGMTEAAHQMASNPLPPRDRKPGSVGLAAGPDVAIMGESGDLLEAGKTGEVVIRGPNITSGYQNNLEANQSAFRNEWFRTGDQGYLDREGYLFLTGRLKEMINRGGEKISPREIDEVLLEHPAIAQALAFAIPDSKLGEEIGAAIVLRAEASATDKEIRAFAAEKLAHFKVPRRVVILKEIPKGPTGKLQRIGLAEKLGIESAEVEGPKAEFVAPRTPTEKTIAEIWGSVLGQALVGVNDHFLQSGGDSILATQLVVRIRETLKAELSVIMVFETPTVAGLAAAIDKIQNIQEYSDDSQAEWHLLEEA
jgi:oxalate---CoA ligase